jgi:hypothetical protein
VVGGRAHASIHGDMSFPDQRLDACPGGIAGQAGCEKNVDSHSFALRRDRDVDMPVFS